MNYQALPDDTSFAGTSGIRIGVQEMTRFGMEEKDFAELAPLMARVILEKESVGPDVEAFRARFRTMRYCLDAEESADIGSGLLASLFPHSEYGERFADNLSKLARLLPA